MVKLMMLVMTATMSILLIMRMSIVSMLMTIIRIIMGAHDDDEANSGDHEW